MSVFTAVEPFLEIIQNGRKKTHTDHRTYMYIVSFLPRLSQPHCGEKTGGRETKELEDDENRGREGEQREETGRPE